MFCSSLRSILIPADVITIGDGAFACSALDALEIPNNVLGLGDRVFQYCGNLTNITIPNAVSWAGGFSSGYRKGHISTVYG